jgi:putative hydrolase of the HAD superfamily
MVRAVLFDAAGTLIETRSSVGEAYSTIALEHGVDLPAWRLQDAFRRVFPAMPPMCFEPDTRAQIEAQERAWWQEAVRRTLLATDSTVRFADFSAYFDALWRHFAAPTNWQLRPGSAAALRALTDAGLRLGVVSNFDLRLFKILEDLEIQSFFDCTIVPGTHHRAKPDPRVFDPALTSLGASAGEAVYVGDEPAVDGAAASAAGLAFIDVGPLDSLARLTEILR